SESRKPTEPLVARNAGNSSSPCSANISGTTDTSTLFTERNSEGQNIQDKPQLRYPGQSSSKPYWSTLPVTDENSEKKIADSASGCSSSASDRLSLSLVRKPEDHQNVESRRSILEERLWNQAYDSLKNDDPKLVDNYEKILSRCLKD